MNNISGAGPTRRELLRALGPLTAMAVVVGNVIGSGIFYKPGNIAADSGDFPLIITMWFVGGGLCILGALCLAELATMLPRAGGLYVYLREAYGRLPAFLFGWSEFVFARPAATAALSVVFVKSMALAFGVEIAAFPQVLLASILILGMAIVNIVGVVWGGRVQLATTFVKAVFLALVALSPFLLAPIVGWTFDPQNYGTTISDPQFTTVPAQVAAVLLAVMWAYNGWHGVTPLAEEVREPQRTIPFALFGGIGVLILLYVAANLTYYGVMSMQEMANAGDNAAEHMLRKLAGQAGQSAMSIVIMCSTFGAINTNLLQSPRITFAMGRDGVFFRGLGAVHANYRTPVIAILLTTIMTIVFVAAVPVAKLLVQGVSAQQLEWETFRRIVDSLQQDSAFQLLTNFVIFAMSIFYLLAVLAVIVLRFRQPFTERPYRTWGYPFVPVLFIGVYIWFLVQVYQSNPLESRMGLVLIVVGIPAYYAYKRWGSPDRGDDLETKA